MTEDYRASVLAAKERKAASAPLVLRRLRDFACAINPGPWPRPTWILPPMLAAAPSPRGSDADLSIVGYVVRGFHDESLPSRHASRVARPHYWGPAL